MRDAKKSELLGRLIADTVSHEMVRPLGLLAVNQSYLWTHLQCDMPDTDEKTKQALEEIEIARENIERIWRNCTDLYACIYDEVHPCNEPVDLCMLLQLIQEESSMIARAIDIRVETKMPKKSFCVVTDRALAEQIILNLLSNALQTSQPGGKIILSLKNGKEGAQLLIQDCCGCMAGQLARTLCCGAATGNEETAFVGSEIGLHLCRELCEILGWKTTVKTNSCGTTVTLDISTDNVLSDSRLIFCSEDENEDVVRAECLTLIRLQLSGVPGMEQYWTK